MKTFWQKTFILVEASINVVSSPMYKDKGLVNVHFVPSTFLKTVDRS